MLTSKSLGFIAGATILAFVFVFLAEHIVEQMLSSSDTFNVSSAIKSSSVSEVLLSFLRDSKIFMWFSAIENLSKN